MKRRNFFALLFAPLLARFAPRSNSFPIEIEPWGGVDFEFSEADFIDQYIRPALKAREATIVNQMDEYFFLGADGVLSSRYGKISHQLEEA